MVHHALLALLATLVGRTGGCCIGTKPDPTFIDPNEYFLTSITPNRGSRDGGARVTLKGGGFNVNFFTAGNYVYIGSAATSWVPCDVIEGACTVQASLPYLCHIHRVSRCL